MHIPWPDPDYWRLLPMKMRQQICEGMLGNDIVGFQTRTTPAVSCTPARRTCRRRRSTIRAVAFSGAAAGSKCATTRSRSMSRPCEGRRTAKRPSHDRYLPNYLNEFTILRVDRVEPSKNIFADSKRSTGSSKRTPNIWVGSVSSRSWCRPAWRCRSITDYLDDVSAIVVRLNAKHANVETGWQPIHLILGENYPRALAAMKRYDVLLVNTIIDGMNLVAKEGVLLNDRNGVLILSEGAGAVQQLGEHALIISPADVEGTADAIYQALTMSPNERRRRADNLRRTVESDDVAKWFREQLWDVVRYAIRKEHDPGSALPDGSVAGEGETAIDSGQDRLHVIISPIPADQNGNTT